jgi:hypothetical protein
MISSEEMKFIGNEDMQKFSSFLNLFNSLWRRILFTLYLLSEQ